MELIVKSQDLVRELGLAQGSVASKATLPILNGVRLVARGKKLSISTSNLELSFQTSCPAEIDAEGEVILSASRLLGYVNLLEDGPLKIKKTAQGTVHLTCGNSRTRMSGMASGNFPDIPKMPARLTTFPAELLRTAILRTIDCVAAEQSYYTIIGAQLILEPESLTFVSTDGHRLSLYQEERPVPGVTETVKSFVARKGMLELVKIVAHAESSEEDPAQVDYAEDDNNLFFRSEQRTLTTRKLTGKFPDYERVMPTDFETELELERDRTTSVLKRAIQFAEKRSRVVQLKLEDGTLECKADASEFGGTEESIFVDYEGDSLTVNFNAQYMIDFMNSCGSEKVLLQLKDERSAAQWSVPGTAEHNVDYRYVIMPIRQ